MEKKLTNNISIFNHFHSLTDPRKDINKRHKLIDIIAITICAVIANSEEWEEIEDFGNAKHDWLKQFLELPNGIPSHDTIRKVFVHLDPNEFENCFRIWVADAIKRTPGEIINIDGKTNRGSHNRKKGKKAIHMVSAWAGAHHITLGQTKTEEKSNEITAIPELLQYIDIAGSICTIDAMGCQKEIVKTIVEKKADYVISLKGNQSNLQTKVEDFFTNKSTKENTFYYCEEEEKKHGRVEQREYFFSEVPGYFNEKYTWDGLVSIGKIQSTRLVNEELKTETRFFISSLKSDQVEKFMRSARGHWSIENKLHWQLDVSFSEDASRKRSGNAAQNFSLIRKIALAYIKNDKTRKGSIARKRRYAAMSSNFLEAILSKNIL